MHPPPCSLQASSHPGAELASGTLAAAVTRLHARQLISQSARNWLASAAQMVAIMGNARQWNHVLLLMPTAYGLLNEHCKSRNEWGASLL